MTRLKRITLKLGVGLLASWLAACQSTAPNATLYDQLGGRLGTEKIADRFVRLVIHDPRTERHFRETNLERFYTKLVEHLCHVSGGGCEYTGDDMLKVHKGMQINQAEFNATVEILQQAMREQQVPLAVQNQLLARLAPLREDIIYR